MKENKDLEVKKEQQMTVNEALMSIVSRPDIDPERLERFLDLQIKMEDRQNAVDYRRAMANFQGECPIVKKNRKVDFTAKSGNKTKYDYANLDEIIHVIKPILQKHGFSYSFNIKQGEKQNELITKVCHSSGHTEDYSYFFIPLHNDTRMNESQRAKSALSYAKRAAIENAFGVVTAGSDDDAARAIDTPASEEMVSEIKKIMEATKTKEAQFAKFLKVDSLDELSVFEAKRALHALRQKRSKGVK